MSANSSNVSRRLHEQPRAKASGIDKDVVELQQGWENKGRKQECIHMQSSQATGKVHKNIFEDMLTALGSCQIIAVASENVFSAVRVTAGARAKQWIDHLSSLRGAITGSKGSAWSSARGPEGYLTVKSDGE